MHNIFYDKYINVGSHRANETQCLCAHFEARASVRDKKSTYVRTVDMWLHGQCNHEHSFNPWYSFCSLFVLLFVQHVIFVFFSLSLFIYLIIIRFFCFFFWFCSSSNLFVLLFSCYFTLVMLNVCYVLCVNVF